MYRKKIYRKGQFRVLPEACLAWRSAGVIFATHSQRKKEKVEKVTARRKIDGTNNLYTVLMKFLTERKKETQRLMENRRKPERFMIVHLQAHLYTCDHSYTVTEIYTHLRVVFVSFTI